MPPKVKKNLDSEDQSVESETMQIIRNAEKAELEALTKSVSFLSADAIRWMNKRRPTAAHANTAHVAPARALELRQIFKGLDFDHSGSIDIEELQEAVAYVAASDSSDPIFKDPKKLTDFFASMDTDGNGTVDFNEFLVAMTSSHANLDEGAKESTAKLQQAFFDFANKHRRQQLIHRIGDQSISDLVKYDELRQLFSITFFKDEVYDATVEDQLKRAKQDAKNSANAFRSEHSVRQKKMELSRAREGSLYFAAQRMPRNVVLDSLKHSGVQDAEYRANHIDEKIRKSFSTFSLHDHKTYIPEKEDDALAMLNESRSFKKPPRGDHNHNEEAVERKNLRMLAMKEVKSVKLARNIQASSVPILPPMSMKSRLTAGTHTGESTGAGGLISKRRADGRR